jgi:hypothetical protein
MGRRHRPELAGIRQMNLAVPAPCSTSILAPVLASRLWTPENQTGDSVVPVWT